MAMADNGIPMPPVRRSATAILEIRTLEGLCRSSFFFFTAKIVNVFKRNAMGAAIVANAAKIQGEVVSCRSNAIPGPCVLQ